MAKSERQYYLLSDARPVIAGKEIEDYRFEVEDTLSVYWTRGEIFSDQDRNPRKHLPKEPIEIKVSRGGSDDEEEGEPADPVIEWSYPELTWHPLPLMSRKVIEILKSAGVGNLQTFETKLINPLGKNPPPENNYLAVNILGLVKHKELNESNLIFRLEEAPDFVIIHNMLKEKLEASNITVMLDEVKILPSVALPDGTIKNLPLIKLP